MPFGEIWPEPQADAYQRTADHNWHLLRRIGGGMVGTYHRAIDDQQRLAGKARERGDREEAQRHFDEVDRLFNQLETYLAYVGSAR